VYQCKDRASGLPLAAKVVSVKRKDERMNVERELEIMRRLHHPRIIQLFDAVEDVDNREMCLILEVVEGGELFDRVIEDEFVLTEKSCAIFVRQICEGVEYIHSKNILHLDMKPENVMCMSKSGNRVKIIDFGLARIYDSSKKMQILFGTPEFVAPEVVNFDEIGYNTDMWSVGVITYVLLSGLSPFMGETDIQTMANVTLSNYDFDDECFEDVSECAQDFIRKLLKKDKRERLTASESLKHDWLISKTHSTPTPSSDSCCSDGESELENVDEVDTPDLKKGRRESLAPPDDNLLSPSAAYLSAKRPSLDQSKDNLKEFVSRYSDNPYLFDSPRGLISNVRERDGSYLNNNNVNNNNNNNLSYKKNEVKEEANLVNHIRRFSKQLHEELELMKKQCHDFASDTPTVRKCSWSDISVNAH